MSNFRKKPVVIEAITFDELVAYGREHAASLVDGMPWSFEYKGWRITHENDQCYLVPNKGGHGRMTPDDLLITNEDGRLSVCGARAFVAAYDPVEDPPHAVAAEK